MDSKDIALKIFKQRSFSLYLDELSDYMNNKTDVLSNENFGARKSTVFPHDASSSSSGYSGQRSLSVSYTDSEKKFLYRTVPQPDGTIEYIVQPNDTIAGIAARFDVTPSELAEINKLSSRIIFPGQRLFVISKQVDGNELDSAGGVYPSPKPGHVERVVHGCPSTLAEELDKECLEKFLKISAKYITDGEGVVGGVLIVTPNTLMFDPNVVEPLVIERGREKYGVCAPMDMVIRAALYYDIARMKVKNAVTEDCNTVKTEVYHAKRFVKKSKASSSSGSTMEDKALNLINMQTDSTKLKDKALSDEQSDIILSNSSVDGTVNTQNDSKPTEISQEKSEKSSESITKQIPQEKSNDVLTLDKSKTLESELISDNLNSKNVQVEDKLGRKKEYFHESLIFSEESQVPKADHNVNSKNAVHPQTNKEKLQLINTTDSAMTNYMNMVDEKLELFKTFEDLVPRPAKSNNDAPLYFCIRMGHRICEVAQKVTPVMNYGKKKLRKEYWFSIPQDRVDNLYYFILRWAPQKYGDIDDVNLEQLGYVPVSSDEEEEDNLEELESPSPESSAPKGRKWSIWKRTKEKDKIDISAEISKSKGSAITLLDDHTPELLEESQILTLEEQIQLSKCLPSRAVGYPWTLIYSSEKHGFSLKTLYREMSKYESPVLLVLLNNYHDVFGALMSCSIKMSDHFYGTGESFLFTFYPEFKCFKWTGENTYFIKGNPNSLAFGAGDGQFGLWLDDDLYHGRTNKCKTYGNDILCQMEDFVVKNLEAWGFV